MQRFCYRPSKDLALGFFRFVSMFLWLLNGVALMAAEPVEVIVEGLEGEELKNVQAAVALPPGLVQEGRADRLWLDRFERQVPERVRGALEPFGYYNAEVKTSLEIPEEGLFRLHVKVETGEPVRVTSAKVEIRGPGAQEKRLKDLLKAFPLKEGDILRQDKYEGAKGALKARALNLGYLDADFSVHAIRVSPAEAKASIELVLETGSQYRFGAVTFVGASIYPESFLRRYLGFKSGKVFSYSKISQTQLNLINSDRFQEVTVEAKKEESQDFRVPIRVTLKPSQPKRLRFGIGYDTDIGAKLSARYQDVNFNRWGHEWETELSLAQRLQGFVTRYVLPSRKDLDTYTSLRLGLEREDTKTYDSRSLFLEPGYVHSFGRGMLGSVYIQGRLEDFTIGEEDGRSRLLMPGLRFSRRQYNDLIRPTRGYRIALETRGAAQILGSDTNFLQMLLSGDAIIPLPFRFSLLTRIEGGTTLSNSLEDLPPSVRFFAGGDRSVRGYAYQSLGPKDVFGNVTGGKHLLVGSIELEKAIAKIFGVAAFYDVGNAFNNFGHMDLQQGVGLGIRMYTPVGPIRLDLARQVGVKDPDFRIHFTVGFGL
jgi:translocation and assembly module TamA